MEEQLQEEEVVEVLISVRPQNQRGPSLAVHLNIVIVTEQTGDMSPGTNNARKREV